MVDNDAVASLAEAPLFRELSREEVQSIVGRMERCSLSRGEILFEEGEAGDSLYVLLEGEVSIRKRDPDGQPQELARLSAHSVLGEIALLGRGERNAAAHALSDLALLSLSRDAFRAMLAAGSPAASGLLWNLAQVLSHRLDEVDGELLRLQGGPPDREAEISSLRRRLLTDWDF